MKYAATLLVVSFALSTVAVAQTVKRGPEAPVVIDLNKPKPRVLNPGEFVIGGTIEPGRGVTTTAVAIPAGKSAVIIDCEATTAAEVVFRECNGTERVVKDCHELKGTVLREMKGDSKKLPSGATQVWCVQGEYQVHPKAGGTWPVKPVVTLIAKFQ